MNVMSYCWTMAAAFKSRAFLWWYLRGNIETLRKIPDIRLCFELAKTQSGEPYVAGFQFQGALDYSWLEKPITNVVVALLKTV